MYIYVLQSLLRRCPRRAQIRTHMKLALDEPQLLRAQLETTVKALQREREANRRQQELLVSTRQALERIRTVETEPVLHHVVAREEWLLDTAEFRSIYQYEPLATEDAHTPLSGPGSCTTVRRSLTRFCGVSTAPATWPQGSSVPSGLMLMA